MPITSLTPSAVWTYFHQLTQIPRPSHHEEAIQHFIVQFGQDLRLETQKDSVGNIIIRKPATTGMENRQGVILQSHLDMVPQANKDSTHNFKTDPIETVINGDWVCANGTTLGADNGMGVAAIMAVLADKTIEHGPIEALFTSTEETGMDGAKGLKPNVLNGDILLNLDSEDEGELYVGCAGGVDATFTLALTREANPFNHTLRITLKGLLGGHSGLNIIDQRGNANKLLARWLGDINQSVEARLISFTGGTLRNAIPREAEICIATDNPQAISDSVKAFQQTIANEYAGIEEHVSLTCQPTTVEQQPLTKDCHNNIICAINASHDGVFRMSVDMPDLVETSSNLAIIESTEHQLRLEFLLRSSTDSARDQLAAMLDSVFVLAKASSREFSGQYAGWQPNPNSDILTIMKATGEQVFGKIPEVKAIHAGLECGILGQHYPHWDMISFGPTIRGAHSPDERVHIGSVATFYDWLLATLKEIPKKSS